MILDTLAIFPCMVSKPTLREAYPANAQKYNLYPDRCIKFNVQGTLVITTMFVTKDFAVKSNLLLLRNFIEPI